MTRVALYFRVSTDEQAKSGYSIADQQRTLRDHAGREGWEVVEEIEDDGYSGGDAFRPGWMRVMGLAEAGEIDLVAATKIDRLFRDEYLFYTAQYQLKKHNVGMFAFDRTGNKIGDGAMISYAAWEREQIAERTRNGKLSKAHAGMVVGGHRVSYGFDYIIAERKHGTTSAVGYEIKEDEMSIVRRIFSLVASGKGLRTVKDILDEECVPTPRGRTWSRTFMRSLIFDDLYKPHTVEELRELGVSEDVLKTRDEEHYGVYFYQGIPVPIPDAGISSEIVSEARRRLSERVATSKANNRVWELSGGILRCAKCGRAMQANTVKYKNSERANYYYRCQNLTDGKAGKKKCSMKKSVNATRIEAGVWDAVHDLVDDTEVLLEQMHAHFESRRNELRGPGVDSEKLFGRLKKLEAAWLKNKQAYEADAISVADLKARRVEIEAEREQIDKALERSRNVEAELLALEESEAELEERIMGGDETLKDTPPGEQRRQLYLDFNLNVHVGADAIPHISGIFPAKLPLMDRVISGKRVQTRDGYGWFVEPPVSSSETSSRPLGRRRDRKGYTRVP